jgi:hypothetical protein
VIDESRLSYATPEILTTMRDTRTFGKLAVLCGHQMIWPLRPMTRHGPGDLDLLAGSIGPPDDPVGESDDLVSLRRCRGHQVPDLPSHPSTLRWLYFVTSLDPDVGITIGCKKVMGQQMALFCQ